MMFGRKRKKPEWLHDLGRLQLEPGDVIVVRLADGAGWMLDAELERLTKQIEQRTGHTTLVFRSHVELGAISK